MEYLKAFLAGGIICALAQLLIDLTKLTPARILTGCVVLGVVLSAVGFYKPFSDFAGAGASVPLTGFGYTLGKGVMQEVDNIGILGALSGGIKSAAAGIAAAVFFSFIAALAFKPKAKS